MSNTIKQTVHKGSKSIDFISHNLRASIVKPTVSKEELIDVPEKHTKERIQTQDVYCHSFYRPNGIDKLIKTLNHKRANRTGAFQSFTMLTGSKPRLERDIKFDSERQAIAFFNNIPKHFNKLNNIEYKEITIDLTQESKLKISSTYDGSSQSLENILASDLTNEDGSKVTNRDKIIHVIQNEFNSSDPSALEGFIDFVTSYVLRTESPSETKDITISFLNKIATQQHQPETHKLAIHLLSKFKGKLLGRYKDLNNDGQVMNTWANASIHFDDIQSTKEFLDRCINTRTAPDYNVLKAYISLTQAKFEKKEMDKFQYFVSLIGLDNAIHTHLDGKLASELLKRSSSPEEIITLIKTLEDKFQGNELRDEVLELKPFIQKYLKSTHISEQTDHPAIKTTIYQKFQKLTGENLNEEILSTLRQNGSFIPAHRILQEIGNLDRKFGVQLLNEATSRIVEKDIGRPGFDQKSKDAFVQLLRSKLAS